MPRDSKYRFKIWWFNGNIRTISYTSWVATEREAEIERDTTLSRIEEDFEGHSKLEVKRITR